VCQFVCLAVTLSICVSICGCAIRPGLTVRPSVRPSVLTVETVPVSEVVICVANRAVPVCSSVLNMSLEFGSLKRYRWIVIETQFHVETC